MSAQNQNSIRKSFLNYLINDFTSKEGWTHPSTGVVYSHDLIKKRLLQYKEVFVRNYIAVVSLWFELPRTDVASSQMISTSTLKRRWEQGVNHILLLLLFPEIIPENFKIYEDNW